MPIVKVSKIYFSNVYLRQNLLKIYQKVVACKNEGFDE